MTKHVNIKVNGRVQGVGFRYHTRRMANEFVITGFVQNKSDGSVYIEAEGEESGLNEFIEWCKHGPEWSSVNNFHQSESPVQNFIGFEIR